MTFDLQLRQRCPHLAIQAPSQLAEDRRTLILPYEIGRFGLVRVYVNSVEVPSTGIYSTPQLSAGSEGPYVIPVGRDSLTIETTSGSEQITLPSGTSVSISQVLNALQASAVATFTASDNKLAVSPVKSTDSYIRLSGPAASALGFVQKGSNARMVYPGWKLVSSQQDGVYTKYIQFISDVKSNPNIRVTYPFEPSKCPRCLSSQVENDISFSGDGSLNTVRDETLLLQESLKIILTELGSNPYHPWYGTRIRSRIGKKNVNTTAGILQEDVTEALNRYRDLQIQQGKYQTLSDKQRISSIDSIRVSPIEGLPTAFEISIVVRNASGQPVNVTSVFTVSGVRELSQGT